jgi:phage replication O-like protein O
MASPQIENGFTKIANELLDAVCRFGPARERIFWVIIRQTYGYGEKRTAISLTKFSQMTGIHKKHINRELKNLEKESRITILGDAETRTYGIVKDYSLWKPKECQKSLSPDLVTIITKVGDEVSPDLVTKNPINNIIIKYKEFSKEIRKETLKEMSQLKRDCDPICSELSEYLKAKILANNPEHIFRGNGKEWAHHIDLMIRIDKRDPPIIREVIDWCQANIFWHSNILSTKKLREKFDQLKMQMERDLKINQKKDDKWKDRYKRAFLTVNETNFKERE